MLTGGGRVSIDRDGRRRRALDRAPEPRARARAGRPDRDRRGRASGSPSCRRALAPHGQMLALDPPGDPTIGACLAGDLSGPRRHRYGAMRDLVIGVTVVLADGTIASSGGKVVKNVAGYDLGKLFSGSRGRLGLIARVALRLHPRPAAAATVVAETDDPRALWQELHRSQLDAERRRLPAAGPRRAALRGRRRRRSRLRSAACPGERADDGGLGGERARCRASAGGRAPFDWQDCLLARPGRRASRSSRSRRAAPGRRSPSASAPPSTPRGCSSDGRCS